MSEEQNKWLDKLTKLVMIWLETSPGRNAKFADSLADPNLC